MRYLFLLMCSNISGIVNAQQPKAYETVHYTAQLKNLYFKLDYADGYPGASRIKLYQPHQKTQVFIPGNGAVETNGNLIFQTSTSASITLSGIDEETPAPKRIKGTYHFRDKVIQLQFIKTQ